MYQNGSLSKSIRSNCVPVRINAGTKKDEKGAVFLGCMSNMGVVSSETTTRAARVSGSGAMARIANFWASVRVVRKEGLVT